MMMKANNCPAKQIALTMRRAPSYPRTQALWRLARSTCGPGERGLLPAASTPTCAFVLTRYPATMPFIDKRFRKDKVVQRDLEVRHAPMGDQRFRQLMSELGAAFALVDDGDEKRMQARERERQRELWLGQREAAILEILSTMRRHGLSAEDLA